MQFFPFILVVGIAASLSATVASPAPQGQYTARFDNINVDEILANGRLLKNYMDCVMGRGKCTREGKELKQHIPEAIATDCAKCSEKQRQMAGKILSYLRHNKKNYWNELMNKYDPDGKFRKRYEQQH